MSDCHHCGEEIIPTTTVGLSYDYGLIGGLIWHLTRGRSFITAYRKHTCPKCGGSWKEPHQHLSTRKENYGETIVLEEDQNAQ